VATWLVSSFSLESKRILPDGDVNATPWLEEGVVTQPWTIDVMSMTTNWSAAGGMKDATTGPRLGIVE
jgi:hypothetical protein